VGDVSATTPRTGLPLAPGGSCRPRHGERHCAIVDPRRASQFRAQGVIGVPQDKQYAPEVDSANAGVTHQVVPSDGV
jgi:hypothetical protein